MKWFQTGEDTIMMRSFFSLILICITFMHVSAYGATTATDNKLLLDKEIKTLQAAYAAWQRNDAEFREVREQNQSSETDIQEFAAFVAGLKRQVIESCETVRQLGGDGNQHGVDCVKLTKESGEKPQEAPTLPERQETGEEKKNSLEEELETLIAEFDELMLEQQDTLKQQQAARQASGSGGDCQGASGGSEAAGTGESGEEAGTGEPGEAGTGEPGEGQMPPKAEPGSGPGMEKQGKMPELEKGSVGDGSDDDVVARQLREAAEAETDPVLKAQLWEEYKKYKNSTR
jgi:hypothetical protein